MKGNKTKKHTGKVEMNTVIFKFIPTMEETYEFVDLTMEDSTPKRETPKKPSKERASLNLEMALLIMLLALAVIFGLQIVGASINEVYAQAAGFFTAGSVSEAPTNPSATDNGDGTYTIDWEEGTAPFTIVRATLPDMSDQEIIGTTPDNTYTIPEEDLVGGDNYITIIDDNDLSPETPLLITIPLSCYEQQDALHDAVAAFAADGGDISILDSVAVARSVLVPVYVSADDYDLWTVCPADGTPYMVIDGEFICFNHPPE